VKNKHVKYFDLTDGEATLTIEYSLHSNEVVFSNDYDTNIVAVALNARQVDRVIEQLNIIRAMDKKTAQQKMWEEIE
jgi:hypothetical protein